MEYVLVVWLNALQTTELNYGSKVPLTAEQCFVAREAHQKVFPHLNYECREKGKQ